jgi:vacuolar-type H+-ATPase subunit I/STV1
LNFAKVLVLIFGNVLVMGLEGLLVAIQVLRLEFYEMFSSIFREAAIPLRPVRFPHFQNDNTFDLYRKKQCQAAILFCRMSILLNES